MEEVILLFLYRIALVAHQLDLDKKVPTFLKGIDHRPQVPLLYQVLKKSLIISFPIFRSKQSGKKIKVFHGKLSQAGRTLSIRINYGTFHIPNPDHGTDADA